MKSSKSILFMLLAMVVGIGIGYLASRFISNDFSPNDQHDHSADVQDEATIWTCSMHPQIQQPEPGDCPICGMELIPLDNSSSSNDPLVLEMTKEAIKLANIQTTVIGESSNPEKSILLNGKIQADERRSSSQAAHIPGRIEQLFITFTGERVAKGQKLAVIYSPELVTAQQELLEALRFTDINPSLVEAARKKLQFWKISLNDIEAIEKSGEIKETFIIYAEMNGVVANRRISVGDYVKTGQVLFDIINLNKLWVLFDGYEEDLANIRIGDRVEFTTPVLPNKTFQTRIDYIDPIINPKTRVASLRAEINNASGILKPEMFVKGEIKTNLTTGEKLTVPKSAILWTGKRSVVYVKLPDMDIPSFKYKEIGLGASLGDNYLVESGLEIGEEVVTHGNFAIDAAAQLNNQQSMMNKVVKAKGDSKVISSIPDYTTSTPLAFKEQLSSLVQVYFDLKDGFVATDSKLASTAAQSFLTQLEKVDMNLLKGEAHMYWMEQLKGMTGHVEQVIQKSEVEDQRTQFAFLSQLMIQTLGAFGYEGDKLYIQHCPMAMNDEGADWISKEEQIKNPYFGDKMMKCGSVTGTFPMVMETTGTTAQNSMKFHNH
ncbi:MAG: efflux RND transporter periplasmic adaptor subunit [Bacteroidetes bacterium]|nr:MAG: efflux RND transporter periplasmic adaptor subunit [Bacteroidota bacterium]